MKIPAIHCESCVNTITGHLQRLPSVQVIEADPEAKLVHVQFNESSASVDQIREALDEIGFSAAG